MNLKDFRPDNSHFDSDSQVSASLYREELNTLKIDKLSNRVTIISIIIPCLIGAILIFAYLDMQERLIGVDAGKQSQFEKISQQLEEKLNALDVKIAKNRFDLDNNLPEFSRKATALEGQIAKMAGSKTETDAINVQLDKLAKQIADNAGQDKKLFQTIENINEQTLSAFKKNSTQFETIAQQIKTETDLLKKEFTTKLSTVSTDDQQLGELRKNLSLMDKKYKNVESEMVSKAVVDTKIKQLETDFNLRINTLNSRIETLNKNVITNISRLQKEIDQMSNKSTTSTIPKTQTSVDPPKSETIEAKPLTQ